MRSPAKTWILTIDSNCYLGMLSHMLFVSDIGLICNLGL